MTLGVLLVGLGGNNGSTFLASLLAHRENITWKSHSGEILKPDWLGSTIMMGSTDSGDRLFERFHFTHPLDIKVGGWDISGADMSDAVRRAGVLNWQIEESLRPILREIKPWRAVYNRDFIAMNQESRADNVYPHEMSLREQLEYIRGDIRKFKTGMDNCIVLWTANTEKMLSDAPKSVLRSIEEDDKERVSPSMIYAVASILEGCAFLNGSPQNTITEGIVELAREHKTYVGGSDFKTGQTRFKSMMMDFLSTCGIRVSSIASYNHLGNNDGLNLSQEDCFKSKEISKRDVIDDVIQNNKLLYNDKTPDHCVVIKYIPAVGDSKRAIDEYTSDIFMGGKQTISVYNVCEDSLLATPVMLDLILVTDYMMRFRKEYSEPVLQELSLFFKAPLPNPRGEVVNIFRRQHQMLERGLESLGGFRK